MKLPSLDRLSGKNNRAPALSRGLRQTMISFMKGNVFAKDAIEMWLNYKRAMKWVLSVSGPSL